MEALSALEEAVKRSGKSKFDISRSMGRFDSYISATISRGSVPKADTMAMILDACDCDLVIRNRKDGSEIVIDPRER